MSLAQYQIFLKVVECGSFTKAAQLLSFTQSGVSHAVSALEQTLGLPLLSRSRGGVALTADGRALLPYIRRLCAQQHQLEQAAADLRGMTEGLVKVAAFSSVSAQWLPYILKTFDAMYPSIEFEVLNADYYDQIESWVASGQADCGFLRLPGTRPLDTWPLHRDELKVILPPEHRLAGCGVFPLEAFGTETFIQLEEGDDYEITAAYNALGVRPYARYTIKEDQSILAMVSNGLGISVIPELMLGHSSYPLAVCDLPQRFWREIGICVRDKDELSGSTRLFVQHVRDWVAANYAGENAPGSL